MGHLLRCEHLGNYRIYNSRVRSLVQGTFLVCCSSGAMLKTVLKRLLEILLLEGELGCALNWAKARVRNGDWSTLCSCNPGLMEWSHRDHSSWHELKPPYDLIYISNPRIEGSGRCARSTFIPPTAISCVSSLQFRIKSTVC